MTTNGPAATIGEILKIELERLRNRIQLADDPQYNQYRAAVLSFLYEKQRNPANHSVKSVEKNKAAQNIPNVEDKAETSVEERAA